MGNLEGDLGAQETGNEEGTGEGAHCSRIEP